MEEDIAVAHTVAMVLKTDGFEATVAYSGETGVELARNREFEYLVTGVVMPQMNGIEAAIEIRKLLPKCKVLLVSGDNDGGALHQEAVSRGYQFEILATPFAQSGLLSALPLLHNASLTSPEAIFSLLSEPSVRRASRNFQSICEPQFPDDFAQHDDRIEIRTMQHSRLSS
ncbi:response regulator [Telmatobacter sp. DSM 110680]|uniref:Response regulator n=1 Tax=Telmatobacter sp. DSM 110680 TaxID=3036704 RepID=A0AAU7DR73_9BACT